MCLQECWLHSLNLFAELQGSSADGVMRIYKDGCLIGENPGAMFGLATYFAEDFSKADLYAGPHCFKRCKGHCHVLVVAVLMGRVSVERSRLRQALRIDSKCFKDSS
jgi:hypothetical protein